MSSENKKINERKVGTISVASIISLCLSFLINTKELHSEEKNIRRPAPGLVELILKDSDPEKQKESLIKLLKDLKREEAARKLYSLFPHLHPYLIATIDPNNLETITGKHSANPRSLSPKIKEFLPIIFKFLKTEPENYKVSLKKIAFQSLAVAYNFSTANKSVNELTDVDIRNEIENMRNLSEEKRSIQLFGPETVVIDSEEVFSTLPQAGNAFFNAELKNRIEKTGTKLKILKSSTFLTPKIMETSIKEAFLNIKPGGTIVFSTHGLYDPLKDVSSISPIPNRRDTSIGPTELTKYEISPEKLISYFKERYISEDNVKADRKNTLKIIYPACELKFITDFLEKWEKEFGFAKIPPPLIVSSSTLGQVTWYQSNMKYNSEFFSKLIFGKKNGLANPTVGEFLDNYKNTDPITLSSKPSLFLPFSPFFDLFFHMQVVENNDGSTFKKV